MAITRQKPETFTDDPAKLADQIEEGIKQSFTDDPYSEYDDTTFYLGEMKIIVAALRAYKPDVT